MAGIAKARGNMVDPEFLAQWEPWRMKIRPPQCHLGEAGVCWVKQPYQALEHAGRGSARCQGCQGLIGAAPSGKHGQWRPGGGDAV